MKRFFKALSLLVAAAVLTVSVSASVSATTVPSVQQSDASVTLKSVSPEGTTIIISMPENIMSDLANTGVAEDHYEQMLAAQQSATAGENATQIIEGGLATAASELGVQEDSLQFTTLFNVYVADQGSDQTVTIEVYTQLAAGTPYVLGHYVDGVWVTNSWGFVAEDGSILFTETDFSSSPFAIITGSLASGDVESPQTGESANALLVASVALVAVAAVVAVSGRKVTR